MASNNNYYYIIPDMIYMEFLMTLVIKLTIKVCKRNANDENRQRCLL